MIFLCLVSFLAYADVPADAGARAIPALSEAVQSATPVARSSTAPLRADLPPPSETGCGCSAVSAVLLPGWVGLFGLLALRRRR